MQLPLRVQYRLIQVRITARQWRLLRRAYAVARYYIPRLISYATVPILGERAALRGYHERTRDLLCSSDEPHTEPAQHSATLPFVHFDEADPKLFVAEIPRGRSLYSCGAIVAPDHKLLADVSWQTFALDPNKPSPLYHFAMRKLYLPKVHYIRGSAAVLASVQSNNYYHWMFDILPRLDILRRSGLTPDYYIVNTDASFQRESLNLLNIPSTKIVNPTAHRHIQADNLIVPSLPGPIFGTTMQAQPCEFLRSSFLAPGDKKAPYRLLYISRSDSKTRRLINEPEVLGMIMPLGFDVLTLAGMSFAKQVELFSQARIVIGPHGAGFSNVVFCQPGAVLIEILPKGRSVDCFEKVAGFVGLDYRAIASEVHPAPGKPCDTDDHYVDIAELGRMVHRVLGVQ